MDLRQIRYFIAVAEERSFTVAARRLNLSQPPLSQQIQSLEAALGAQLLYRTSRRVELTQAGEALLARARAIQQQIKLAEDEVRSIGAGLVGSLDIGATGSILRGRLADLLAAYRKETPAVKMTVHEQAPALQIAALLNRTTNISLNRSIPAEDTLSSELAWPEEVVVAMPKTHPLARRKRIALGDLASEDHIVLQPESSQFARYIQKCCVDAGFLPRVSQQVVDAQSVPSLIAAGFGVALVRNQSPASRPTRSCSGPSGPRHRPPTCFSSSEKMKRRWWYKISSRWRVVSSGRGGIQVTWSPADEPRDRW